MGMQGFDRQLNTHRESSMMLTLNRVATIIANDAIFDEVALAA
jgi:hypothetical protein